MTVFCKDCKHIELSELKDNLSMAKCKHPNSVGVKINLVTGVETKTSWFCNIQRESPLEERCGPEAEWFESKWCETCDGTGEFEGVIPNSQPPDWKVTKCEDCHGTGEAE
jgi:DnaJ-class molecular chaperone